MTFSVLYLNVMSPLNESNRFIDEAHESSLKVGDLVDMLSQPVDRSFRPTEPRDPMISVGSPLFVADDLRVVYLTSDGQPKPALNGVTLSILHGETIGVAGRSGCGKSTWLRVLMRLTHPSGGTATLGGVPLESVTRESIADLIGYVGQNPSCSPGRLPRTSRTATRTRPRNRFDMPPGWPAFTTRSTRCRARTRPLSRSAARTSRAASGSGSPWRGSSSKIPGPDPRRGDLGAG